MTQLDPLCLSSCPLPQSDSDGYLSFYLFIRTGGCRATWRSLIICQIQMRVVSAGGIFRKVLPLKSGSAESSSQTRFENKRAFARMTRGLCAAGFSEPTYHQQILSSWKRTGDALNCQCCSQNVGAGMTWLRSESRRRCPYLYKHR